MAHDICDVWTLANGVWILQPLTISANSFDVLGARACGMRAAFVNRNTLPYEETPYRPDVEVGNFTELAEALL